MVPWNYDYSDDIYDGLFISNGPGDPALAWDAVLNLRKVCQYYMVCFDQIGTKIRQYRCWAIVNLHISGCNHLLDCFHFLINSLTFIGQNS